MYSSGWLNRAESSVEVTPFAQGAVNFEAEERALSPEQQQLIIARVLYSEGSYWLFHRPLVDETTAAVLERRPEERVWLVVKAQHNPHMDYPCHLLRKDDLVKVGRVRFKVREIESPIYRALGERDERIERRHQLLFPSFSVDDEASFLSDQTSMAAHSRELLSEGPALEAQPPMLGSLSENELNEQLMNDMRSHEG